MKLFRSWKFITILFLIICTICLSIYFLLYNIAPRETDSATSQKALKKSEIFNIAKQKIDNIKSMNEYEQEQKNEEEASIEDFDEKEIKTENLDIKQTQSNNSIIKSNNPYYIKINISANVVTIYSKDSEGNFTVPIKAMICSTGRATPHSGRYKTGYKARWIRLFGGVHGQYSTKIVGNILFHSVPYLRYGDPGSLEYWEYDKLGTSCSMGCVRLCVSDAKWIYDNIGSGTIVEFYSSSEPGPLGKPSSQKISSNTEKRDWDPTDPDQNNPWINKVTETVITISPSPSVTPNQSPNPTIAPTQSSMDKPETSSSSYTNSSAASNTSTTISPSAPSSTTITTSPTTSSSTSKNDKSNATSPSNTITPSVTSSPSTSTTSEATNTETKNETVTPTDVNN